MRTYLRSKFLLEAANWCPGRDLNPHSPCGEKDFKSFASADFATRASAWSCLLLIIGDSRRFTGSVFSSTRLWFALIFVTTASLGPMSVH